MTALHREAAAGWRRRREAAQRLPALDDGRRDPGTGHLPRRDRIEPPRRPRATPEGRLAVWCRAPGQLPVPPGVDVATARRVWQNRPDLRTAALHWLGATLAQLTKETTHDHSQPR